MDDIEVFNRLIEKTSDRQQKEKLRLIRDTVEFMAYHGGVREKDLPWVYFLENNFDPKAAISAEEEYIKELKRQYDRTQK